MRTLRRQPSSSGPPILTIGARSCDGGQHIDSPDDADEDAAPWHDPQYVAALIDQAARQRAFDGLA